MPNVAYKSNNLELENQLIITNYGQGKIQGDKLLFFNDRPFPLYEPIRIIGYVEEEVIKKDIKQTVEAIKQQIPDELERMIVASKLVFGSRLYGKSFHHYIDLLMSILDYFSDKGIQKATFQIKELWIEDGDLIDRAFSVIDYKGEETGINRNYAVGFYRKDDVPLEYQEVLEELYLFNDEKFAGIYEYFVLIYQDNPLNLENSDNFWNDNFSKEKYLLQEKRDFLQDDFFKSLEFLNHLTSINHLENVNLIDLIKIIKNKMELQKEIRKNDWEIEKKIIFDIGPGDYPYTFNINF